MKPAKMPMSSLPASTAKAAILEAAGATSERLSHLLLQALEKQEQLLHAKTTKLVTHQGEVTDTVYLEDNKTQLEASKVIADLVVKIAGLQSKNDGGPKQSPTVVVNIPAINEKAPKPVIKKDADSGASEDYLG